MPGAACGAHYQRAPYSPNGEIGAHLLRHSLIGLQCPLLVFDAASGENGDTASLVAYVYPGSDTSEEDGSDTPRVDADEHRGFRDAHDEIAAEGFAVVGISSQSVKKQREAIIVHRLPQQLASDTTLRLATRLKLPIFGVGDDQFYQRLTIIIARGRITQAFYPVAAPGRHAGEVIDWLTAKAR